MPKVPRATAMPSAKGLTQRLSPIAEGFSLAVRACTYARENDALFLHVVIDRPDGAPVSLSDCENFHRAILEPLDGIPYDYLDVSSRGADAPLEIGRDFHRHIGKRVEVRLYEKLDNGKKSIIGRLKDYQEAPAKAVTIESSDEDHTIDLSRVALVRPVLVFTEDEEDTAGVVLEDASFTPDKIDKPERAEKPERDKAGRTGGGRRTDKPVKEDGHSS